MSDYEADLWRFADLTLDEGQRCVLRSGQRLPLAKLTFDFLALLVERAPNVVTHEELAQRVWPRRIVTQENMSQRASLLRHALGDDAKQPKYVRVVHGLGYQLIPPTTRARQESPRAFFRRKPRRTFRAALLAIAALFTVSLIGWGLSTEELGLSARRTEPIAPNASAAQLPTGSAVARWRAALAEAPNDTHNLVGLGRMLCASGRFDEALEHLRKAESLRPDSTSILESLARCLLVSPERESARAAIARGVALDAHFPLQAAPINPGLEDGLFGWGRTWDRGGESGPNRSAVLAIDTAVVHSGKASGRLRLTEPAIGGVGTISGFTPLDFLGGRVRMSAYLKTEHIEQGAALWLRVDSLTPGGLQPTFFENTGYRGLRGDTHWSRQDIVADVPAGAVYIVYGFGFRGTGTVWIDDVAFERVADDTPLTGALTLAAQLLPEPDNLAFDRGLAGWSVRGDARVEDGVAHLVGDQRETTIRQDISSQNFRGKRLRLKARVNPQTDDGALRGQIAINVFDYTIEPRPVAGRPIDPSAGWRDYDLVLDVPEVATKISYFVTAGGGGTLLVDDVKLDVVDTTVPLTPNL